MAVCREQRVDERPKVGVLIETPSAVFMVRELLEVVDFVSIGMNDLTQFMLLRLCKACRVEPETIVELVNRGVLKPTGGRAVHWRFSSTNVSCAYAAARLQKEFGMNLAGVVYTLELLEINEALCTRLRELERMLDYWHAIAIGY